MLVKKFKAFYNKEGFDYSKGYIDPRDFHLTFFFVQRAFQVIDEPFQPWTYVKYEELQQIEYSLNFIGPNHMRSVVAESEHTFS